MAAEEIESLADKYLKNRYTPSDAELVLNWFGTPDGLQYLKTQLNRDIQLLENENLFIYPVNVKSAEIFGNIMDNIEEQDATCNAKQPGKIIEPFLKIVPSENRRHHYIYRSAAVLTAIFIGTLIYFYYPAKTVTRYTKFGETARIILPDSSAVTLNGNSKIEYAASWESSETREVKLQGEAFFSIKHKINNQKFIVRTADTIQVEVLGTEFNISDRKGQTQIVLVSGKIRLDMQHTQKQKSSLIMNPGESVEIKPDNGILHKHHVEPSVITSWTGNKLIFDNTSVREICERLKNTYGYQIVVSDKKILDQLITGSVPNQNIDMVLEGLEAIMNVTFKKTNK